MRRQRKFEGDQGTSLDHLILVYWEQQEGTSRCDLHDRKMLNGRLCFCLFGNVWTLNMLDYMKHYKIYIRILNRILIWLGPSEWKYLRNSNRYRRYYTAYTIPADALATLGDRASSGMVLTPKAGIFRISSIRKVKKNCTPFSNIMR